jgi:hypothetical protein
MSGKRCWEPVQNNHYANMVCLIFTCPAAEILRGGAGEGARAEGAAGQGRPGAGHRQADHGEYS